MVMPVETMIGIAIRNDGVQGSGAHKSACLVRIQD